MKVKTRKIVQIFFLALFLFLILTGRVEMWMALFLLGILASFIFGRFYCGWICSINTVMGWVTGFKKKHGIKNRELPEFVKKPITRWLILGLFFAAFVFTVRTGKKLPVLPVLFLSSVLLTFFFHEELWHRFLCPYGSILSLSGKLSNKGMIIDGDKCVNCGECAKVCPALSIDKNELQHIINRKDCLICLRCTEVCNPKAISYK